MPWPGAGEAASGCLARQVQSRRETKLWNPAERALFHSTLLGVHVSDEFFGFVLVPHGEFRLSLLQPCTSVVFATPITNRSIQKLFPIGWCPVLAAGGAPGRSSRSALADLAIATPSLSSRGGRPRKSLLPTDQKRLGCSEQRWVRVGSRPRRARACPRCGPQGAHASVACALPRARAPSPSYQYRRLGVHRGIGLLSCSSACPWSVPVCALLLYGGAGRHCV